MSRRLLGLAILGAVVVLTVLATVLDLGPLTRGGGPERVAVSIYYGGEKSALLADPEIQAVLDRHGVDLDAVKAGSVEQATTLDHAGKDCLWPSTALAVEYARQSGKPVIAATTLLNAPMVLYAWDEVAEALIEAGVAFERGGFLRADLDALVGLVEEGARWREDLGVAVYGAFKVHSTDPTKSNSGNIWAAMLATAMNGGETPDRAAMGRLLPRLDAYFQRLGHMEASSGDIFENFLKQGMGARPLIVGYENQLVEFLEAHPDRAALIRERIRVIYLEPTVFSSHPLVSLTPACARLAEALEDPEAQAIAWARHGFRTGLIGVENDPDAIAVARLPERVDVVQPLPRAEAMTVLIEALR